MDINELYKIVMERGTRVYSGEVHVSIENGTKVARGEEQLSYILLMKLNSNTAYLAVYEEERDREYNSGGNPISTDKDEYWHDYLLPSDIHQMVFTKVGKPLFRKMLIGGDNG